MKLKILLGITILTLGLSTVGCNKLESVFSGTKAQEEEKEEINPLSIQDELVVEEILKKIDKAETDIEEMAKEFSGNEKDYAKLEEKANKKADKINDVYKDLSVKELSAIPKDTQLKIEAFLKYYCNSLTSVYLYYSVRTKSNAIAWKNDEERKMYEDLMDKMKEKKEEFNKLTDK